MVLPVRSEISTRRDQGSLDGNRPNPFGHTVRLSNNSLPLRSSPKSQTHNHPSNAGVSAEGTSGFSPIAASVYPSDIQRLRDARLEFDAFLKEHGNPIVEHFRSVTAPANPLRMRDGDVVRSTKQLRKIQAEYQWSIDKGRWTLKKNGGPLITEEEVFNTVLSFRRTLNTHKEKLFSYIYGRVGGVQSKDVKKIMDLWKKHKLEDIDPADDALWGGIAAYNASSDEPQSAAVEPDTSDIPGASTLGGIHQSLQPGPLRFPELHPRKRRTVLVGLSANDGSSVWATVSAQHGTGERILCTIFYDHNMIPQTEESLNIDYFDEFKVSKFPKPDGDESQQVARQRQRIYDFIEDHARPSWSAHQQPGAQSKAAACDISTDSRPSHRTTRQNAEVGGSTSHAMSSKRPLSRHVDLADTEYESSDDDIRTGRSKRPRFAAASEEHTATPPPTVANNNLGFTSTESTGESTNAAVRHSRDPPSIPIKIEDTAPFPAPTTRLDLPSQVIEATSLWVSVDGQPDTAPINLPLSKVETLAQFFGTLISECDLQGKAASDLKRVSANYMWGGRGLLIRRDFPHDWEVFVGPLRRAWETDLATKDSCDVELQVHVSAQ